MNRVRVRLSTGHRKISAAACMHPRLPSFASHSPSAQPPQYLSKTSSIAWLRPNARGDSWRVLKRAKRMQKDFHHYKSIQSGMFGLGILRQHISSASPETELLFTQVPSCALPGFLFFFFLRHAPIYSILVILYDIFYIFYPWSHRGHAYVIGRK